MELLSELAFWLPELPVLLLEPYRLDWRFKLLVRFVSDELEPPLELPGEPIEVELELDDERSGLDCEDCCD